MLDKTVADIIEKESRRQQTTIPLIASENFCSKDVRAALGSVFVNKYAEGRPGQRYYAGNQLSDEIETLAAQRALDLFLAPTNQSGWAVNVQPLSGTAANLAVFAGLLKPGDRILSMNLDAGGHLSHGHPAGLVGQLYEIHSYGVNQSDQRLNYSDIAELATTVKPKIIIAGASAYPRQIDFPHLAQIAHDNGALLMADISHIAGLIAAKLHISPFPTADIVTTTTHKTLRGPRAALIFCRQELSKQINRGVFPGVQGGPHLNQIAATAVALQEASSPDFRQYAASVISNAGALATALQQLGWNITSGGTDNHLLLIDLTETDLTGAEAQLKLEKAGIITNANRIPFDRGTALNPSGLRLGTAAVTTLGANPDWMRRLGQLINNILRDRQDHNRSITEATSLRQELLTEI